MKKQKDMYTRYCLFQKSKQARFYLSLAPKYFGYSSYATYVGVSCGLQNMPKTVSSQVSALDPAGGVHNASPDLIVSCHTPHEHES